VTDIINWVLLILGIAIAIWFLLLLFKVFFVRETYPKEIEIALIGAAATMLTILGAVKTTQDTNASNAALQRAAEVRTIKQQYYTGFFEAFWKKGIATQMSPNNEQAVIEASTLFSIELGRLPLYASQDFVEFVNRTMKTPNAAAANGMAKMYELMRADLVCDDYSAFTDLELDTVWLPNSIDSSGQQDESTVPSKAAPSASSDVR
jgi:hypothetical protein